MTSVVNLLEAPKRTSLEEVTSDCSTGVKTSLERPRDFEELSPKQQCEISNALAHDFNDMLSVIIGFASMVHEELDKNSPHRDDLAEILSVSRRASRIAKELAKVGRELPKPVLEKICDCGD